MKRVLERKSKAAWHSRVAFCVASLRGILRGIPACFAVVYIFPHDVSAPVVKAFFSVSFQFSFPLFG